MARCSPFFQCSPNLRTTMAVSLCSGAAAAAAVPARRSGRTHCARSLMTGSQEKCAFDLGGARTPSDIKLDSKSSGRSTTMPIISTISDLITVRSLQLIPGHLVAVTGAGVGLDRPRGCYSASSAQVRPLARPLANGTNAAESSGPNGTPPARTPLEGRTTG
jgi:hypothetical protein